MLQNANLADWCGSIYVGLFVRRRHREKEKKKTEETKSNKEKQVKNHIQLYKYNKGTSAFLAKRRGVQRIRDWYRYIPIFNQHQK